MFKVICTVEEGAKGFSLVQVGSRAQCDTSMPTSKEEEGNGFV